MKTATPHAVAYIRVSTTQQAESGLGLEAQQATIAAAAQRHGLPLAETFTDAGLSGSLGLEDRPGLFAAIGALRRGDVLLVAKRDRLGRDLVAVAMLERTIAKRGARVLSAAGEGTEGTDASSLLQRHILDAFSEYERRIIGQRTKAALKAKKARGERVGNIAFGYQLAADGTLTEHPDEQAALVIMRDCRAAGYTLRAIADELNRQGLTTRAGGPWRHEYVAGRLAA
jgi:DNA invertase Pin-like site-specific DNA recombinase